MFTGFATAGAEARTTVTIKGPNGDFHGKIKSPDDGCVGDRVVRLFMSDNAEGPFERTGNSDTSQQNGDVGEWSLGNTGPARRVLLREGQGDARLPEGQEPGAPPRRRRAAVTPAATLLA